MNKPSSPPPSRSEPPSPAAVGKPPVAPGDHAGDDGSGLPLPHERDESPDAPGAKPRAVIEQARRDIESGQVDTDMRTSAGLDADAREKALRGGGS
ncbi:hypothetical protein CLD22_23940 [Rubrivivax gelatinosus]|nr:hypothetical protein [Rubrivivax gelatinosus]